MSHWNTLVIQPQRFAQDTELIFFDSFLVIYIEDLCFMNLHCGDIEINLGPFNCRISNIFLDSSVTNIYDETNRNGYNFMWSDHLSNTKHGCASIYHKDPSPNIDKCCIWLSDHASFHKISTKINFAVKPLKKGLNKE